MTKIVEFRGFRCAVDVDRYANGNTSLSLVDAEDGCPIARCSVNFEEPLRPDLVWIKDWSENEGMADALVEAGVIELTGVNRQAGYVEAIGARVL